MIKVNIWTGDVSSNNNFELLLNWLELAAADAAAADVVPSRTQWILNKQSKRQQRAQKNRKQIELTCSR
jgi:hypothetical protein